MELSCKSENPEAYLSRVFYAATVNSYEAIKCYSKKGEFLRCCLPDLTRRFFEAVASFYDTRQFIGNPLDFARFHIIDDPLLGGVSTFFS